MELPLILSNQIKFIVHGKPIAKKRPRFARRGKFVQTYNDQETEEGKFLFHIQYQFSKCEMLTGPLKVEMIFHMPRPKGDYGTGRNEGVLKKSAPEFHIKKPDVDNLEKFASDCLSGTVWKDDSQIVQSETSKRYSENPRTEIIVYEISGYL